MAAKTKILGPRIIIRKLKKGLLLKEKHKKPKGMVEKSEGIAVPVFYPLISPLRKKPEKKIKEIEGIEIKRPRRIGKPFKIEGEMEVISYSYPLIPLYPKRNEPIYAYVHIGFDKNTREYTYSVIEPKITQNDIDIIERVKKILEERLDVDISKIGLVKAKRILLKEIENAIDNLDVFISSVKKNVLIYYIQRDFLGLGKIEPLMRDPNIEDISCDGVGIEIFVYHRNPKLGSLRTNIRFETRDEIDSFILKLAQKCNKTISVAEPLLDGTLPDGSRVQATLGTDIARRGSNFTIRKFSSNPLTPTHMLRLKTLNSLQLAYLWLAVENGMSILVSGGTATGKTSLLNVLSLFIRPNLKVVSIEDTSELRLPLKHWIPHVARSPLSIKSKVGEVTLFDLLKASLRQRPDYIILGEVRGKEAFVLFQQIATGHSSLATIHAASIPQLIDRLITPPISLPAKLIENIDIVIFLILTRLKNVEVRRVDNILEITGVENDKPTTRTIFEWIPSKDEFIPKERSVVLKKIAKRMGVDDSYVVEEIYRRKRILEWMVEREIYDYKEVAKVIHAYYHNPERILDYIEEVG